MKSLLLGLVFLTTLLVACAPSEEAIQQAIEETAAASPATQEPAEAPVTAFIEATSTTTPLPTATAEPTPAPTVKPSPTAVALSEIDLGPLLIVEGDLPEHLDGDFVVNGETFRYDREEIAEPDNLVSQQFYDKEGERLTGGVAVYVYEDNTAASQVYGALSTNMTGLGGMFSEFRDDVGERAKIEQQGSDFYHLAFLRCHAFAEIFMFTPREFDIVTYAQRLDGRLTPVVCPAGE